MATVTTYIDGKSAAQKLGNDLIVAEVYVDATASSVLAANTYQIIKLPKGAVLYNVLAKVVTGDGVKTVTVTDGTTAYLSAVTLTTGVHYSSAVANIQSYAAADTLDLTVSADTAVAQVLVIVKYGISQKLANS